MSHTGSQPHNSVHRVTWWDGLICHRQHHTHFQSPTLLQGGTTNTLSHTIPGPLWWISYTMSQLPPPSSLTCCHGPPNNWWHNLTLSYSDSLNCEHGLRMWVWCHTVPLSVSAVSTACTHCCGVTLSHTVSYSQASHVSMVHAPWWVVTLSHIVSLSCEHGPCMLLHCHSVTQVSAVNTARTHCHTV